VTESVLSEIASIILDHPDVSFIVGGDLNSNIHDKGHQSDTIIEFMVIYDFHCCDEKLTQSKTRTYHHASLAHNSYVDVIFLPRNLINTVKSYDVIDDVVNLSDHVPVVMQM